MKLKKMTLALALMAAASLGSGLAFAQDPEGGAKEQEEAAQEEVYVYPAIKPEFSLTGGYRFVNLEGSSRADEFEYLQDSFSAAGTLQAFSFPHRIGLDLDIRNKKDYFGDLGYAYEDLILFRGINRTLFHNLDTVTLIDLDTSNATPRVDVRDTDNSPGTKVSISSAFLRFKAPDFPFHLYIDGSYIKKSGSIQQRFLGGSGSFNSIERVSQTRDIDWETKSAVFGMNSHIGPVEVDLSHGEKRFDSGDDSFLTDAYLSAGSSRDSGDYAHNLISDTKGSSNTLKLHTSYTGRIVASATVTKMDRENEVSGTDADYLVGSGEITWLPMDRITVLAKYRRKETDIDTPESVSLFNACSSSNNSNNNYACTIRDAVSSTTDTLAAAMRYRLSQKITLRAEYTFDDVDREHAEEWELPDSTERGTASLAADYRILSNLTAKAKYTHRDIESPAYNIEPDYSDEGRASVTWIPVPQVMTLLSYTAGRESRRDLWVAETDGSLTELQERSVSRQRVLGSLTVLVLRNLSATASYAYLHSRTRQDIEYHHSGNAGLGIAAGTPIVDSDVPYKESSQNVSFSLAYTPQDRMSLSAGISHTSSEAVFYPSSDDLLEAASVASFSQLRIKETVYTVGGECGLPHGFSAGVEYRYSDFNDALDNPYDDVEDGKAHVVFLTLSKKW